MVASDFYTSSNPQKKQLTTQVVADDGRSLSIVIDKTTNAIYLSDSTGATTVVGISELASTYSHGNATMNADFIASVQKNLSSTTGIEIIAKQMGHALAPPNGIARPCDLAPCGVMQRRFIDGQLDSMYRWNIENVDHSYQHFYTAEEIAEDQEDFERWQRQQCDTAGSELTEAFLQYLATIPICAFAETGLGALGCSAAIGSGVKDHNDSLNAERDCRMAYPGPGQWGRP